MFLITSLSAWSAYAIVNSGPKHVEIKEVLNDMYIIQKEFIIDVNKLSSLLIEDSKTRGISESENVLLIDQTKDIDKEEIVPSDVISDALEDMNISSSLDFKENLSDEEEQEELFSDKTENSLALEKPMDPVMTDHQS